MAWPKLTHLYNRLISRLSPKPHDRETLIKLLRDVKANALLNDEALSMLEGVLQVSEMHASDIMVPRSQMITIEKQQSLASLLPIVVESQHSRFPVYNQELDNVESILLAKDLLTYLLDPKQSFDIRALLRPAMFIPASKRLNTLLREFRSRKNHMAIIVDEYGDVAGLITIEDILEQIVGEIDDEHDTEDENAIKKHDEHTYIVKAGLPIDEFNKYFASTLADENCDTIGGLVIKHFGHVPSCSESLVIGAYTVTVLHADARRVHVLQIKV